MEKTGIDFFNNIHNTKDFNIFSYRNFYNGGGVAIGDINNDGLADIFFTANMGSNKLYLNKGNWHFEDISKRAGIEESEDWSTGVVLVDINNDGWLDIFVCTAGYRDGRLPECKLFINNHDLTFQESAAAYGLTNRGGYTTHAAFFDYDMDGDLDCFIINNSFIPVNTLNYANKRNLRAADWPVADFLKGGGDRLLRNDDGKFTDVSKEAGIYGSLISFGLGATVGDVNGDHYPDIYVSNDFFERDYLYINQKNGTYKDELENRVQHTSLASMGADLADINNDGLPDIFTTDMLPYEDKRIKTTTSFESYDMYHLKEKSGFYHQFTQNTLQLNSGVGKLYETAHFSGVAASDWSWGGLVFDADNDGWNDIFVCNGIYHDVTNLDFINFFANDMIQKMVLTGKKEEIESIINKMPSVPISNKVFRNNGDLTFKDAGNEWGLNQPSFSNGSAYGDLDNDGDLDLVTNNVNGPAFIYRNNAGAQKNNHYIAVTLKQSGKNTFAVGSSIRVFSGEKIYMREVIPTRGFQSSVDYKNIIGLGNSKPDSMMIIWPDRTYSMYYDPAVDTTYNITKPLHTQKALPLAGSTATLLKPVASSFDKHTVDDHILQ
ncbi:MAG TPA: CRTAC1 family protein [Agriterribacter sp.]|nr:CRTAC1 family protein [Agriterribacter sp.]